MGKDTGPALDRLKCIAANFEELGYYTCIIKEQPDKAGESVIQKVKPVIKGTRLTVEYILNLLAHGSTSEEILHEYEGLTQEDIQACLLFATRSLKDTDFMPLSEQQF